MSAGPAAIDPIASGAGAAPVIAVLPDHIVDQIAAGEVVERPASVVKELVENALDAGATHITVEVEAGGKRLIRVLDNGRGMTRKDVRTALKRHATSKLRCLEDVFSLGTMGFRGEALPSIAAVSQLTITTRSATERDGTESVAATRLVVSTGKIVDCTEVGAPVGTQMEVRDLLANVPARLKFLKGDATEASHVTDVVTKLAMAHPSVHFRLRHGSRNAIDAPLHANGLERARALLGARIGGRLHAVQGVESGVEVTAYLAAPELSQTTSRGVQMFVGRRVVRDRGLLHAVRMGYGELVPKGKYPVVVLLVDAPSGSIDVNVHPQKLEVRFSDPQAVYAAVRHTIAKGVAGAPWLQENGISPVRMQAIACTEPPSRVTEIAKGFAQEQAKMLLPWGTTPRSLSRPALAPVSYSQGEGSAGPKASRLREPVGSINNKSTKQLSNMDTVAEEAAPAESVSASASEQSASQQPSASQEGFFSQLVYLGQLDRTYLVCESRGELVLIDQHAAHERVAFQRLRETYRDKAVPVQRLLFPTTVAFSKQQVLAAKDCTKQLTDLGFEIEPFGGETIAIKAVPSGLRSGQEETVLRELLDELGSRGGSRAVEDRVEAVLATIACHSVVRAGDTLSIEEVRALLETLDGVDFRTHCPHGRPVLLRIPVSEIGRRLGRT